MTKSLNIILITLLFLCPFHLFSQYKTFSGINDTQFNYIDTKLEQFGFGKVTCYYNDVTKKNGIWELYPKILITDSIFAVKISTIKGLTNQHSFIVLYDSKSEQVLDTIGTFFDTHSDAIMFKHKNGKVTQVTLRLCNPPEPFEPRFTFIKYIRKHTRLIMVRRYARDF
ncbi:MAG: hypothetical protein FWF65_05905 [Bacteroidetes bacterium]|nr:hypothetical protein [Bacteroidota bacterium]